MQHNDIRHSLCYGCVCFIKEEVGSKYICTENGQPLRVGKHKVPLKHQGCKGPHDDISTVAVALDEFNNTTDAERKELYDALENGTVHKGEFRISEENRRALRKAVFAPDKTGIPRRT